MRIVLLGPPGVGKGTQARTIQQELRIPHLSTGDMLRDAVRRGTQAGNAAKSIMDSGGLVPDELVGEMVSDRLRAKDCGDGFLLDGFPRTVAQVEMLDRILAGLAMKLDRVVLISAPEAEIVRRLSLRRSCPACGAIFHLAAHPPRQEGRCDSCGSELIQRSDDREDVVRSRLAVYREQTQPLVRLYRERGLLAEVDGTGSADDVAVRIRNDLKGVAQ